MLSRIGHPGCCVIAALVVVVAWSPPCAADTFTVDITADTNDGICGGPFPCSLRDAVMTANAHPGFDTIEVPAGTFTLTIPGVGENGSLTGDLDVLEEVMIIGAGAGVTIIDGNGIDRVFNLRHPAGTEVTLWKLTVRGGDSSTDPSSAHGAGVSSWNGNSTFYECVIEGNRTNPGHGGGLYQRVGTMRIWGSLVQSNSASGGSGVAVYLADLFIDSSTIFRNLALDSDLTGTGGAVWAADSATEIVNSTVTGNQSLFLDQPSGIFIHAGSATIASCTIAGNFYDDIHYEPDGSLESVILKNNVIDGTCGGFPFATQGGNVEGPGDTCALGWTTDFYGASIVLFPLGNYGGKTPTMPPKLVPGGLIIDNDRAEANCESFDQRAISRPQDGDGDGLAFCDSGAVEYRGLIFGDSFETGSTNRWSDTSP